MGDQSCLASAFTVDLAISDTRRSMPNRYLPREERLRYSRPMGRPPVILSIAGYDPSSGAGITADIKTAAAHNCYAVTCITALTVQSTQGVFWSPAC